MSYYSYEPLKLKHSHSNDTGFSLLISSLLYFIVFLITSIWLKKENETYAAEYRRELEMEDRSEVEGLLN